MLGGLLYFKKTQNLWFFNFLTKKLSIFPRKNRAFSPATKKSSENFFLTEFPPLLMWWEARGKKVSSFLVSSFSSILAHWFNYCHFLHFALNLPFYPSCFSICSISLSMMPNLCMLIQLFSTSLVSYIKSLNIHLSGTARYHHNAFKWNLKINTTTTREIWTKNQHFWVEHWWKPIWWATSIHTMNLWWF